VTKKAGSAVGGRYMELVREFPLRPLRSETQLRAAVAVIDSLAFRGDRDEAEDDYLAVLSVLVEEYEARVHPRPAVSDGQMLRSLLASSDITQAKLAKETGITESTISEVLADKKRLRRQHIGAISRYFGVSPATFDFDGPNAVRRPIDEPEGERLELPAIKRYLGQRDVPLTPMPSARTVSKSAPDPVGSERVSKASAKPRPQRKAKPLKKPEPVDA
jgi:HTH-type transcriptional regulator/antitoxin HigA